MNIKKPILITGAASLVALGGVTATGIVSAAAAPSSTTGQSGLVDKIASKFHLNKSEVQAVFDQNRTEHQAKRQQKFEDRLNQAVKDGKLTSGQKDQILAKEKELKDYRDSLKGKSPQEVHKLMKAKLDELKAWAKQNDIPMQYLRPGPGGPHGSGSGSPGHN